MLRGNAILTAACVVIFVSTRTLAADADNIGTLGRIQTHTLILNARLKEQQAQAQLDGKAGADGAPTVTAPVNPADQALPNVRMIVNGDNGPSAIFVYAGGITAAGHVGTKIPGNYTVKSMSVANRSVEVVDSHGKTITLGMSSSAPVAPTSPAAPSGIGMFTRSPIGSPMVAGPAMVGTQMPH